MRRTHSSFSRALISLLATLALALGLLAAAPAAQADQVRPDFFGMHDARVSSGGSPGVDIGAIRLWDTGTSWRQIETRKGDYTFAGLDTAIAVAERRGAKPMIVLGQTPRFWASKPRSRGAYGKGAASMPTRAGLRAYTRYVKAVVKRYGTRAEYQVWNEPNVVNYFNGKPAQMATLTKLAYRAIKGVNRGATVVAPSMPLRLSSQRKYFAQFWGQRVGRKPVAKFVNVVGIHPYPAAEQAPEQSMSLVGFARKVLRKKRVRKPLWNLEINYGLKGGPAADPIPSSLQAAYVARTLILNAASPIKRTYWYSWNLKTIANTILSEADNQTPTEAGRAYGTVRGWLINTDMQGCSKDGQGLYTCTTLVNATTARKFYWKPSGSAVSVRPPASTTSTTTLDGTTTPTPPILGPQPITVGRSPVMATYTR